MKSDVVFFLRRPRHPVILIGTAARVSDVRARAMTPHLYDGRPMPRQLISRIRWRPDPCTQKLEVIGLAEGGECEAERWRSQAAPAYTPRARWVFATLPLLLAIAGSAQRWDLWEDRYIAVLDGARPNEEWRRWSIEWRNPSNGPILSQRQARRLVRTVGLGRQWNGPVRPNRTCPACGGQLGAGQYCLLCDASGFQVERD